MLVVGGVGFAHVGAFAEKIYRLLQMYICSALHALYVLHCVETWDI